MAGHRLEPLQALRRSDEEQAMSRLADAVASRARAETEARVRSRHVEAARARLAAALGTSRFAADPEGSSTVVTPASRLQMAASFVARLRIEARRSEQRLAAFVTHQLARALATEEEARAAYCQQRGSREGLDKHVATLDESERRRVERLSDET